MRTYNKEVAPLPSLSKEIAKARKAKGLSLRELAEQLKLSRMVISNVEHSRSTLETSVKVAKAVGIRGEKLLTLVQRDVAAMVRAA